MVCDRLCLRLQLPEPLIISGTDGIQIETRLNLDWAGSGEPEARSYVFGSPLNFTSRRRAEVTCGLSSGSQSFQSSTKRV